jgi:hypothetical protein
MPRKPHPALVRQTELHTPNFEKFRSGAPIAVLDNSAKVTHPKGLVTESSAKNPAAGKIVGH